MLKTGIYIYDQTNSGGHFTFNDKLTHNIFIEAESPEMADEKAESLGIYFDGVVLGYDCECCGNRWYRAGERLEFPMRYGEEIFKNVEEYAQYITNYFSWLSPDARIFYLDGTVKEFFKK